MVPVVVAVLRSLRTAAISSGILKQLSAGLGLYQRTRTVRGSLVKPIGLSDESRETRPT
jgi:hypothetical protein